MKTNFWKSAAAFVMGMAAMVACDKNPGHENVAPVFPSETIEKNVEAGETVEIQFTANLDWELSIPSTEQTKYWLDDAGMPASKVSGKAGEQTVSVVFSEDEYYDENLLCEVTLTMGGQSQVIAKLTRLAINRALEVYVAEKTEWNFKSTYGTEKVTALALTTFEGDVTYTLPIKVVANYDWSLALPTWCEGEIDGAESLSGKAGQAVEVLLTGKLAEELKNGAEDVAKFIDATDNAQSLDLPLTFPAFADRIEWSEPASMDFDHTGSSTMPAIGYVLAMDGYVIRALGWNGEWHDTSFADWVTVTPGEATEGLIKMESVTLGVTENTGKERYADLFVFPASMAEVTADAICDPVDVENCSFLPEYQKYYVGRLTQAGVPMPYISEYTDAMMGIETYEASLTTYTEGQWWASLVGGVSVANQYELCYWNEWSELTMLFDSEYSYYKIYDYDFNEVAEDADFWFSFSGWSNKGKVTMEPAKFSNPNTDTPESFIVFFDESGKALAGVCCKYTSAGGAASGPELTLVMGDAVVSTVTEATNADLYWMLAGNLSVSNVYDVQAAGEAVFNFNQSFDSIKVYDLSLNESTAVACEQFDQTNIYVSPTASNVEAIIVLRSGWLNVAAIHYVVSTNGTTGTHEDYHATEL